MASLTIRNLDDDLKRRLDIPPREPYRPDPSLDWFMDESIELPDPKPKAQS